jgi:hypothetical protein
MKLVTQRGIDRAVILVMAPVFAYGFTRLMLASQRTFPDHESLDSLPAFLLWSLALAFEAMFRGLPITNITSPAGIIVGCVCGGRLAMQHVLANKAGLSTNK